MSDVSPNRVPTALTIAGSDSGGGAGVQADLKTFAAHRVYGMSAITAVTAQNTLGVYAIHDVPPEVVTRQIELVLDDIGAGAIKTGMLSSAATVDSVANVLSRYCGIPLVVDPVMGSTSGSALLNGDAIEALRERLFPLATIITPNIPEAEALTGLHIDTPSGVRRAAEALYIPGGPAILIKGGHFDAPTATDWFFDGDHWREFSAPRIDTRNTHGTGCTYSAAIAARLALGLPLAEAIALAKQYVSGAISRGLVLGHGHGPLDHGWT